MTNTNGDEVKSTNDSELPWMAKGSKSSTKSDEKAIVRVADSDDENKDKSSSGTVAKESEPRKPLGQHVGERVGRVPMKKRRLMDASPSPRKLCGRRRSSEHRPNDGGTSDGSDAKNDSSGHDFYGIEILADAACNLSDDLAPAVDRLPSEESVVQQQDDVSTILPHAVDSTDQVGQGKNDNVSPQKSSFDLADEKGTEHIDHIVAAEGASESENSAPDSGVVIKSEKTSASEPTEKKNARLHWDLNVSMDAWGPPCDVEDDDASEKDIKPMGPRESEPIDGSNDHLDELVVSATGPETFSSPCGPKAEAAARNGDELESGYYSPLEDGELREPEDERFYSMAESNDNKIKDYGEAILAETKFGPLKSKSDDALRIREAHDGRDIEKRSSSSSRRFVSKPFKELPSHDAIPRTRSNDYEELSMDPYKCYGRHERSCGRRYSSGWGSKPRCVYEPPHRNDQSGSGSGQGSQPDGYVRNRISNGGYRGGRFRRFPNGGDRVLRGRQGDNNQFSGRMHNWTSGGNRRERGNSPVFRRSISRSQVPRNGPVRLSPHHDGFKAEERVRFPFQRRFLEDQEIGFVSPPRNTMPSQRFFERRSYDSGANHNSFRGRRSGLGQSYEAGRSLRGRCNYIQFGRPGIFVGVEDSSGGNKFEMRQQRTRRAEVTGDGGDDVRRLRFHKKDSVGVASNNNDVKEGNENKITR